MSKKYYKTQYTTAYISLSNIKGDFTNHPLKDLIIKDRGYDWSGLLHDIDSNGLKELIEITKIGEGKYKVVQGNHRLKILEYLYPQHNVLKFKIKRYETNR
jgi:hypothetical protein